MASYSFPFIIVLCILHRCLCDSPACSMFNSCVENSCGFRQRTVVIGDVHGTAFGLFELLYEANITSSIEHCEWKNQPAEGTLLVQVGDIVDRGHQAFQAWVCLEHLQSTAPAGSSVVRLIGC